MQLFVAITSAYNRHTRRQVRARDRILVRTVQMRFVFSLLPMLWADVVSKIAQKHNAIRIILTDGFRLLGLQLNFAKV